MSSLLSAHMFFKVQFENEYFNTRRPNFTVMGLLGEGIKLLGGFPFFNLFSNFFRHFSTTTVFGMLEVPLNSLSDSWILGHTMSLMPFFVYLHISTTLLFFVKKKRVTGGPAMKSPQKKLIFATSPWLAKQVIWNLLRYFI